MIEPAATTPAATSRKKFATEPVVEQGGTVRAKLKSNGKEITVSAEHFKKYRANFA